MRIKYKLLIALTLTGAIWLLVLLKLGLWHVTLRPDGGVLSYTFNGWAEYPASRHLFLGQYNPDDFAQGRAYTTYTYPFLFFNFLILTPLHFLLKLPYEVAQNFLPFFYVLCLAGLFILTRRDQLLSIVERQCPFRWLLAFITIGIVVTDPLPWVSSLNYNQDNFHILAAGAFCYLSTWVFRDEVPKRPLLLTGVFLALWSPIYLPAWILASLFFNRPLKLERKWLLQVGGISALALLNLRLPLYVCRWAKLTSVSSDLLYRSGLDGSTQYMTSIYQAIFSPFDQRRWATAFYLLVVIFLGVAFQSLFRKQYRPLQQALFLLIPYSTMAILFPQFTSIHPYFTDLMLVIPAIFLISFWCLQREFWENLTGRIYVMWLLVAGLTLMTNLLTVAQNFRR